MTGTVRKQQSGRTCLSEHQAMACGVGRLLLVLCGSLHTKCVDILNFDKQVTIVKLLSDNCRMRQGLSSAASWIEGITRSRSPNGLE